MDDVLAKLDAITNIQTFRHLREGDFILVEVAEDAPEGIGELLRDVFTDQLGVEEGICVLVLPKNLTSRIQVMDLAELCILQEALEDAHTLVDIAISQRQDEAGAEA